MLTHAIALYCFQDPTTNTTTIISNVISISTYSIILLIDHAEAMNEHIYQEALKEQPEC